MADATLTCNELNVALNSALKTALVGTAEKFKGYVDVKVEDVKSELKEQVLSEISGIDGLNEQLEKVQGYIDALSKVFDDNEDGELTPEELINKLSLMQQAVEGLSSKIDLLGSNIAEVKEACEAQYKELSDRVAKLEFQASQNKDDIAAVKAELATNVVTKEYIECAVSVNVDDILKAVGSVFVSEETTTDSDGAETEETASGDGAVE